MDVKALLIGALIVAVAVLGFLYYQDQQNDVEVDIGGAQIERTHRA
jgi:predicted negative regulator of RcsB-dependent stress response